MEQEKKAPIKKKRLKKPKQLFNRLYSWSSPEREWEPRNRQWYVLYSLFFILIIFVTVILAEYLLTLAIIAFIFLWFTHASIPPDIMEHTITTIGVKTFDKIYKWKQIKHYWISEKSGIVYLNLDIIENPEKPDFIRRLSLILNDEDEDEVFYNLLNYLDYGDRDEIGYNIFTKLLHGKHRELSHYLQDEAYTQEQYLETNNKKK
jgi:hypothetical protein